MKRLKANPPPLATPFRPKAGAPRPRKAKPTTMGSQIPARKKVK